MIVEFPGLSTRARKKSPDPFCFIIDGLMLGSEGHIRIELERMLEEGIFTRRKNPRPLIGEKLFMIREQRFPRPLLDRRLSSYSI